MRDARCGKGCMEEGEKNEKRRKGVNGEMNPE
jgi:hypothetical protein